MWFLEKIKWLPICFLLTDQLIFCRGAQDGVSRGHALGYAWCLCFNSLLNNLLYTTSSCTFLNNDNKDVKKKVLENCIKLTPELKDCSKTAINTAHRFGKHEGNRKIAVFVLYAFHWIRETVWMKAKNSIFLRERKLHFGKDLTDEKNRRNLCYGLFLSKNVKRAKRPT